MDGQANDADPLQLGNTAGVGIQVANSNTAITQNGASFLRVVKNGGNVYTRAILGANNNSVAGQAGVVGTAARLGMGLKGINTDDGVGIYGISNTGGDVNASGNGSGTSMYGYVQGGTGIYGDTFTGRAVEARGTLGDGLVATSSGPGKLAVLGTHSDHGTGVKGVSNSTSSPLRRRGWRYRRVRQERHGRRGTGRGGGNERGGRAWRETGQRHRRQRREQRGRHATADGNGSGTGVQGMSNTGVGVRGDAPNGYGIYGNGGIIGLVGITTTATGLWGQSTSGLGVVGYSLGSATGVYGHSDGSGIGVHGDSVGGIGVEAVGNTPNVAGAERDEQRGGRGQAGGAVQRQRHDQRQLHGDGHEASDRAAPGRQHEVAVLHGGDGAVLRGLRAGLSWSAAWRGCASTRTSRRWCTATRTTCS